MSKGWSYKSGDWNITCDSCGKKFKASHAKHRWDGFIVCHSCFEERHPQDYIKAKTDKISVPFVRPPNDTFISDILCTTTTRMSAADWGTADCAIVDIAFDWYEACPILSRFSVTGIAIAGCAITGKI